MPDVLKTEKSQTEMCLYVLGQTGFAGGFGCVFPAYPTVKENTMAESSL